MDNVWTKAQNVVLLILVIVPIFFLPFTQDFYETNKWYVLVGASIGALLLWSLNALAQKKATIALGPRFWAPLGVAAAGLLSLLIVSPNKVEAILSLFGPALFLGASLLLLIVAHERTVSGILRSLLPQAIVLLGLLALLQLTGVVGRMFPSVSWLADPLWTPAGGSLTLLALSLLTLPFLVEDGLKAHKQNHQASVLLYGIETVLVIAAAAATLAIAWGKFATLFLPLSAGWQIMLEALKRFPATLVGVGPENFLSAFSAGKPTLLNMTPIWNTRFLASATTALHMGTTIGLIGLAAFVFFLITLAPRALRSALDWARLGAIVVLLLTPPSIAVFVFCIALLFLAEDHKKVVHLSSYTSVTFGLLGLLAAAVLGFFLVRAWRAEHTYFRAYLTRQQTDGGTIQRTGQQAIRLNPYVAKYHEAYAQTNLILAAAIARQATSEGTLSEEDRQAVTQLISQSVREGKLATQLAPTKVTSWETLARLYQSLIGIADGADAWAIASYQKAIELDPTNPGPRLELGSIYLAQKNIDAAVAHFAIATALKPDLANAHYNLANAFRVNGNIQAARDELLKTQALLTQGTDDYEKIAEELAALDRGEEIIPSSTPVVSPPIELPESSFPSTQP
jgi:Flp pilus assembly protein TadD